MGAKALVFIVRIRRVKALETLHFTPRCDLREDSASSANLFTEAGESLAIHGRPVSRNIGVQQIKF